MYWQCTFHKPTSVTAGGNFIPKRWVQLHKWYQPIVLPVPEWQSFVPCDLNTVRVSQVVMYLMFNEPAHRQVTLTDWRLVPRNLLMLNTSCFTASIYFLSHFILRHHCPLESIISFTNFRGQAPSSYDQATFLVNMLPTIVSLWKTIVWHCISG